ncbi:hypothetical protein ASwh1_133 [Aeromonas phage Aswh_1]|nr:hypothetical protein ASwh1_133 [Aeromonas phage Aswh_1]
MKVTYENYDDENGFVPCKMVNIIVKHFMKFAAKAIEISGTEMGHRMELLVTKEEGSSYEFSLSCVGKLSMIRCINLHTGYFEHDTFVLSDEFKGKGLVNEMLACSVAICEELRINKVFTSAIMDGRVVWLKRGFIPFCCKTYFERLENVGVNVLEKDRNEYWFTKENIKTYEKDLAEVTWHGYAMVETLKEFV